MPHKLKWCEICDKPQIDCVCQKKRRKLTVYFYFSTHLWGYVYGAAYTQQQFARLMGSNLYTLGSVEIEDDPKNIKIALKNPFKIFYSTEFKLFKDTSSSCTKSKEIVGG